MYTHFGFNYKWKDLYGVVCCHQAEKRADLRILVSVFFRCLETDFGHVTLCMCACVCMCVDGLSRQQCLTFGGRKTETGSSLSATDDGALGGGRSHFRRGSHTETSCSQGEVEPPPSRAFRLPADVGRRGSALVRFHRHGAYAYIMLWRPCGWRCSYCVSQS